MTEDSIRQYLRTKQFGRRTHAFESIDSTNNKAKSLALEGAEEGTLIIADEQTAGRGRLGRTWQSERGKNLTFSLIVRPTLPPDRLGLLSLTAGLAIAQAVKILLNLSPDCKWPNDVLLDGKKFCGILSEAVLQQRTLLAAIIGAGVNVNQTKFSPELQPTATSLSIEVGHDVNREEVLAAILLRLEHFYGILLSGDSKVILSQWRRSSMMFRKRITVNQQGRTIMGTASALDDDGGLILLVDGKKQKLLAGDVTIVH